MQTVTDGQQRIMLAGGGTAGHVSPPLAVLEALTRRLPELQAQWVGSERVESRIVPLAGVDFQQIDIRFSWRRPTPANWGYYRRHILPLLGGRPFRQAAALVEAFEPQLVLASGGYVAAPVLWAAQQRGIPYALLQIDSPPGLVNAWFAPGAWRVYAATDEIAAAFHGRCAAGKLRVTGYPALAQRRTREQLCAEYGIDPARRLLTVMGGSLGAGAIHRALGELLAACAKDCDPRWAQLAVLNIGGEREELASQVAAGAGGTLPLGPLSYHSVGYLTHAVDALYAADFYIGRSGAATVGELIAAGPRALLIPDLQHADRQQYANAAALVRRGQGAIVEQREASGQVLLGWLRNNWELPRATAPAPPAAELIADDLALVWEAR